MLRNRGRTILAVSVIGLSLARAVAAQPTPTPACDGHRIRFVNQCEHAIWRGEFGNVTKTACTQNSECSDIQFCNLATCTGDTECPAIDCTT